MGSSDAMRQTRGAQASLAAQISRYVGLGVQLWIEHGRLHYSAPKGCLTIGDLEWLKQNRAELVACLTSTTPPLFPGPDARIVSGPISFPQLYHWNLNQLATRHAPRWLAYVGCLQGSLQISALDASVEAVVKRHDALRTRIVPILGTPTQLVENRPCRLQVYDLNRVPERHRKKECRSLASRLLREPIDLAADPLCEFTIFRLDDNNHVLMVLIDHIVADGLSVRILLRDLQAAYLQASSNHTVVLPAPPPQFAAYAEWQRNTHDRWAQVHGAYWDSNIEGSARARFPEQMRRTTERRGWGTITVRIEGQLRKKLRTTCIQSRSTEPTVVLSAYVALVMLWCEMDDLVIQYMTSGRDDPRLAYTIGYFACPLHLRAQLYAGDRLIDLVARVTHEYCNALEHHDHARLAAQDPPPEFARTTCFNWIPRDRCEQLSESTSPNNAIRVSSFPLPSSFEDDYECDGEPGVMLVDGGEIIIGSVYFPTSRFSPGTMELFGRNLILLLEAMTSDPETSVRQVKLLR